MTVSFATFTRGPFKLLTVIILLIIVTATILHRSDAPELLKFPSKLLRADAARFPIKGNLVAQTEGIARGPWIIEPSLPPELSTKPFTIRFKCLWNDELCPKRYIVVLRGPTIYTPPVDASHPDPKDASVVTVDIQVPESGQYELYAWPDFETCHWGKMTYPINRGQVMGTPLMLNVTGPAMIADSLVPCELTPERQPGRWIHKPSLHRKLLASPWAQSFPENQEYIFQPYACKRGHHTALELANTTAVDSLLFVGDSVLRGAFCSQIWPQLAPSGTADGNCTFINDPILYHVAPKDLVYTTPGGRKIPLAFRFMDDRPNEKLAGIPASLNGHAPSHIIANLGLWLAPFPIEKYQSTVAEFLQRLFEMYPAATFIWRTTTDVAPMIQCFSDKGMTRAQISAQRDTSLTVVSLMRAKGMRIFVVDGYAMTTGRPDSGNDGRHWVVESPDEQKWLPKARPAANDAEKAILDGIWDVVLQDDLARANKAVAPA